MPFWIFGESGERTFEPYDPTLRLSSIPVSFPPDEVFVQLLTSKGRKNDAISHPRCSNLARISANASASGWPNPASHCWMLSRIAATDRSNSR